MPVLFRVINVPMRFVLGLPISTPLAKRLMLVHLTGRKTGRHYRQPISYVRDEQTLLTPGGGRWKLNLIAGQPTHVHLRGRDISLRPELVRDPAEVERLLAVMSAKNPMIGRFVPIPKRADGHYDPDRLEIAIQHGFCIVRWSAADAAARETIIRPLRSPPTSPSHARARTRARNQTRRCNVATQALRQVLNRAVEWGPIDVGAYLQERPGRAFASGDLPGPLDQVGERQRVRVHQRGRGVRARRAART